LGISGRANEFGEFMMEKQVFRLPNGGGKRLESQQPGGVRKIKKRRPGF